MTQSYARLLHAPSQMCKSLMVLVQRTALMCQCQPTTCTCQREGLNKVRKRWRGWRGNRSVPRKGAGIASGLCCILSLSLDMISWHGAAWTCAHDFSGASLRSPTVSAGAYLVQGNKCSLTLLTHPPPGMLFFPV